MSLATLPSEQAAFLLPGLSAAGQNVATRSLTSNVPMALSTAGDDDVASRPYGALALGMFVSMSVGRALTTGRASRQVVRKTRVVSCATKTKEAPVAEDLRKPARTPQLRKVDHVTYLCAPGMLDKWIWFHTVIEGGKLIYRNDDVKPNDPHSSMRMVRIDFMTFGVTLLEGIDRAGESQVNTFVKKQGDHTVQHVAFDTYDLDAFRKRMEAFGCRMRGRTIVRDDGYGLAKQVFARVYEAGDAASGAFPEYVQRPTANEIAEFQNASKAFEGQYFFDQVREATESKDEGGFIDLDSAVPASWKAPAPVIAPHVKAANDPPEAGRPQLRKVDHIAFACAPGQLEKWAWYHIVVEGGTLVMRADDVKPEDPGSSMRIWCIDYGDFGIALIEGIDRTEESQVNTFVKGHGDHAIQHVAYDTYDLDAFRQRVESAGGQMRGKTLTRNDGFGILKQVFARGYERGNAAVESFAEYVQRPISTNEDNAFAVTFSAQAGKGFYDQVQQAAEEGDEEPLFDLNAVVPKTWQLPVPVKAEGFMVTSR